jgi:hypothetical protein
MNPIRACPRVSRPEPRSATSDSVTGSGCNRSVVDSESCGGELTDLMFIRFVVGNDAEHHRSLTGIITEARMLRDKGALNQDQVSWLEEVYAWFNATLPVPPFSFSAWPRDAVTWFRDDAGEAIKKMWEIASLLKEHGVPVRMLRSANPGKILYQDPYQIVVEEWRKI